MLRAVQIGLDDANVIHRRLRLGCSTNDSFVEVATIDGAVLATMAPPRHRRMVSEIVPAISKRPTISPNLLKAEFPSLSTLRHRRIVVATVERTRVSRWSSTTSVTDTPQLPLPILSGDVPSMSNLPHGAVATSFRNTY